MLPVLAEMRELVTAIRIQARDGGNLWDRALRTPLPCLPVSKPQRFELEIWDVGPRPQGEQIDNPEPHIDDGEPILLVLSH